MGFWQYMTIIAITKKNQPLVNRATKVLVKYNELNNLRDIADGDENLREFKKLDRLCAAAFDKYEDICFQLPKREINQIEKILL
jgi:hypothetical protein